MSAAVIFIIVWRSITAAQLHKGGPSGNSDRSVATHFQTVRTMANASDAALDTALAGMDANFALVFRLS